MLRVRPKGGDESFRSLVPVSAFPLNGQGLRLTLSAKSRSVSTMVRMSDKRSLAAESGSKGRSCSSRLALRYGCRVRGIFRTARKSSHFSEGHAVSGAKFTDVVLFSTLAKQNDSSSQLASPSRTSSTMAESLGIRRCIVLYDHIDVCKIDSSRGYVCAEQDCGRNVQGGVGGKCRKGLLADSRWKVTVKGGQVIVRERR